MYSNVLYEKFCYWLNLFGNMNSNFYEQKKVHMILTQLFFPLLYLAFEELMCFFVGCLKCCKVFGMASLFSQDVLLPDLWSTTLQGEKNELLGLIIVWLIWIKSVGIIPNLWCGRFFFSGNIMFFCFRSFVHFHCSSFFLLVVWNFQCTLCYPQVYNYHY